MLEEQQIFENLINISQDDMAKFIEKIYNNNKMQNLIEIAEKNGVDKFKISNIAGEFMCHYYQSTGDNSINSINNIFTALEFNIEYLKSKKCDSANLLNNRFKDNKLFLFDEVVFPNIIKFWTNKLKIENMNLENFEDVKIMVLNNCLKNKFKTHSFNGALIEKVKNEGLNIDNELFKKEFENFSEISKSPFSVGKLFFCELGEGTFAYTNRSPERLWMILKQRPDQKENESNRAYGLRSLTELLEKNKNKLTKEKYNQLYYDGKKMIDFYCSSTKNGIAIKKEEENFVVSENCFSVLKKDIEIETCELLNENEKPEKFLYKEVFELKKKIEDCESEVDLYKLFNIYENGSDDKKTLIEKVKFNYFKNAIENSQNNLIDEGYLDGYEFESCEDFALAEINNPVLINFTQNQNVK